MNQPSPVRLEFMDCLGCGKRVATTAKICRHCNTPVNAAGNKNVARKDRQVLEEGEQEESERESHAAISLGGYDDYGMDDSIEESTGPTRIERIYWFAAVLLLLSFVVAALFPFLGF